MITRFLLLASFLIIAPIAAEDYELEEADEEAVDICIPEEECEDDEISCRSRHRYRGRRRRCCCNRDIDATWPGKMENSFIDEMTR